MSQDNDDQEKPISARIFPFAGSRPAANPTAAMSIDRTITLSVSVLLDELESHLADVVSGRRVTEELLKLIRFLTDKGVTVEMTNSTGGTGLASLDQCRSSSRGGSGGGHRHSAWVSWTARINAMPTVRSTWRPKPCARPHVTASGLHEGKTAIPMDEFNDLDAQIKACVDCGKQFLIRVGERRFYLSMNYPEQRHRADVL